MSFYASIRNNCKKITNTKCIQNKNTLKLHINTKNNIIVNSVFTIFDNKLNINTDTLTTDWLKGKNIINCSNINNYDITNYFNLSKDNIYASILIEKALKNAIIDYKNKIVK